MNHLPDSEWNLRISGLSPEEVFACHEWEFSRTAVLEADPSYVHKGFDPYAKYGLFELPWPHCPFMDIEPQSRKIMSSNYHPQRRGLWPQDYRHFVDNYDDAAPQSLFAFQIDWTCSPDKLSKEFFAWLELNKPQEIQEEEARGRGPRRSMEADLKALGIYRIIQFHHATPVSEIIDQYKTEYSDETAWSKAKGRAILALKAYR